MNIPPLLLARVQFTASLGFLALFLAISLALAWLLLFFKLRARWSGQSGWTAAYRFWVRIFALAFVLALACTVPVLIQLGSLWSGLMDKIGNLAGPLLGYGVLSIFIVKSCFLGVMLFGQRRVSDAAHTLAVLMVAIGQLVAVGWVLALFSWLQTPDGAVLIDGRYQVYDWRAVVLNPSFGWRMGLTVLGAFLTAGFLMLGVTAMQALRRPLDDGERHAFRAGLAVALLASLLLGPVAAGMGEVTARLQPAKAAAAAGFWHSGAEPEVVVFGWPSARAQANLAAVSLPGAGGRWLHHDAAAGYLGLDKFSGMQPPVAFTFWSLRLALGLGLLMLAASCATLALTCRRGFDPAALPRWWLRVLSLLMFAGALGVVATWCYDLAGMQPYAVNRAVTQSEVLGPVTMPALLYSLAGHIALYAVLLAAFVGMLFHAARYGVVPVRKTGGSS